MEMVQFHPTGLLAGPDTRMTGTVLEEGLRGAGGHLLDGAQRRFMADYDPKLERATRDIVSRAIYAEMRAGRTTPNGGVYIKMGHLGPDKVAKQFKGMVERCADCGFDLAGGLVEVVPTAHYMMGGVEFRGDCSTALPGLYVAGEDSGGVHGANRLGGNSLSDLLVFGKRAGEGAADFAKSHPQVEALDTEEVDSAVAALMAPLDRPAGENPYKLQAEIQEAMSKHAPIVRDAAGMEEGLKVILDLGARASHCGTGGSRALAFNPGWHTAVDVRSMLVNAEALLRSALERKESRGAHARSDFPKLDDELAAVNFVVEKTPDGMAVKAERRTAMPAYLEEVVHHSYARYTPEERE
jgi:fumarate reductase flavoprotein subunit